MRRVEIRNAVRSILRDEGYPSYSINDSLNSILGEISNEGRYRFQQTSSNITLITGTYEYTVPSTLLAEYLLVFQPFTSAQAVVQKDATIIDTLVVDNFTTTGDYPTHYARFGDSFFFRPVPNAAANGKVVRVYQYKDIVELTSDTDTPSIPARYHRTLLVYGTAARIAPNLQVETGGGTKLLSQLYTDSFTAFINQELWDPLRTAQLQKDFARFGLQHQWGFVTKVRG